jgi:hypothetical protein
MSESVINEPNVNQAARIFNHLRSIYLSQQTVAVLGIFDEACVGAEDLCYLSGLS